MSPSTSSYAGVYVCVSLWACVCAPITTKSAENVISLTDIKETQEGRWSVFSHGEPHFSPRPVFQSSLTPTQSLHLYCRPTTWWHMWRSVALCQHVLSRKPNVPALSDVQTGFSFGDLQCLGFGAVTHCFSPQSDDQCVQSGARREKSNVRFGNMSSCQREWWRASKEGLTREKQKDKTVT